MSMYFLQGTLWLITEIYPLLTTFIPYVTWLMSALIAFWLLEYFHAWIKGRFVYIFKKKRTFTESTIRIFIQTFWIGKILAVLVALIYFLPLEVNIKETIHWYLRIFFLFYLVRIASEMIRVFFEKMIKSKSTLSWLQKSLIPFLEKVIVVALWGIVVLLILSNLGYNISGLLAGAWVAGIAIGLAAQRSIANIFWALTILLNRPFEIGDFVNVWLVTGTVKDIWLTYITIVDTQGHEVMIPNETIITSSIANQSRREHRRADMSLGLVYETSWENMKHAVSLVESLLERYKTEEKLKSYRVHFDMFWDFSLNILVTYFSLTSDYTEFVKEKETINLEIKKLFEENNIEIAFPTSEMIIKNENSEKSPVKKAPKKSI